MIVISTGCPASIGPEISIAAVQRVKAPCVLVGDYETLQQARELAGISAKRFEVWTGSAPKPGQIAIYHSGPKLGAKDRAAGKPTKKGGQAQLYYVNDAFTLAKSTGSALVTAAVSKAAIAHSGVPGAETFRGHTEWLQALDNAPTTTMCFYAPAFSTSLVTTHLPLSKVPAAIDAAGVTRATLHLVQMLRKAGIAVPEIAVGSLNPHAGEGALLGDEEANAIVPGIARARAKARGKARIHGPIGAETAYRKAANGGYHGVVAMYHDQATIPLKLVAFGDAVNVTMGLSIVRTSVDHGTAYDIAWTGKADATGMKSAVAFAVRLAGP
jgi:4-hydroxythreonine-4-phosphate dehydrogenase